jgi:hypothetical protein
MTHPESSVRGPGLLRTVDAVLRGSYADKTWLDRGGGAASNRRLVVAGVVLGAVYGASLGAFGITHGGALPWLQLASAALKLPALFALTLVVTLPSLGVFAALMRSPLGGVGTLRLLLAAILVHLAVLASLGPVFAFFAASTGSYPFLLLLHVLFCAIGGVTSVVVLRRAATAMFVGQDEPKRPMSRRLLTVWCLLYGMVGAQMGWLLRPFLGEPGHAFTWFCPRESNVFAALLKTLAALVTHE